MKIGNKLRKARVAKKISQEELAELLNTTQKTISNFESDKSFPNIGQLSKIQEVLDLDILGLLSDMGINFQQTNENGANRGLVHVLNYYESEKTIEILNQSIEQRDQIIAQQRQLIETLQQQLKSR